MTIITREGSTRRSTRNTRKAHNRASKNNGTGGWLLRCSLRRATGILSVLIMASSFLFLFLFHALHKQDLQHHHQHPIAEVKTTNKITPKLVAPAPLPPLTAFVEATSSAWLQSRPLRRRKETTIQKYVYPKVQTCRDIPNRWPVDHPIEWDDNSHFGPNVGELQPLYPHRFEYAERFCPVDADPFLPWIHDVFVNRQASHVEFIAHNKRRCRTAPVFRETDLKNLEPQVALLQSVPVKRLNGTEQREWLSSEEQDWLATNSNTHRYRLASLEEADPDGKETRFICQFHSLVPDTAADNLAKDKTQDKTLPDESSSSSSSSSSWTKQILGETLSVFPFNYEHANFRKGPKPHPLLTRPKDDQDVHGAHNEQVWNSILLFSCPIPSDLQSRLQNAPNTTTTSGGSSHIPSVYLDLVPIRTPPREDKEGYCPQIQSISHFDPGQEWGKQHVLPPVEQSGRWANIPLCPISSMNDEETRNTVTKMVERPAEMTISSTSAAKPHYLVGCLWASAVFKTRGNGATWDTSTSLRLLEWLTYHLYIAKFNHIYIYDNTEAFTNETSLEAVSRLFPPDRITRIPWKFRVCNNNHLGERSSQYAAEASCRVRYGPTTEWMSFFDTDEYLIPQTNWTDLQTWLKRSVASGAIGPKTNILSFYQTRALPNVEFMEPYIDTDPISSKCTPSPDGKAKCLAKSTSATFLESYDCEPTPLPKPDYGFRAKKQLFRPSFVLNHFVHYTTVTRRIHEAPGEPSPPFVQRRPYERRVDELTEAFMLHTKTTNPVATANWKERCRNTDETKQCPVGIAWPTESHSKVNTDGLAYNCYQHTRIQRGLGESMRRYLEPLIKQYEDRETFIAIPNRFPS
jgi:hypothetical protein